ncbi:unnamed protein product [Effrenium voratum]|nr:unnamed protein product [Effrenium voratum]
MRCGVQRVLEILPGGHAGTNIKAVAGLAYQPPPTYDRCPSSAGFMQSSAQASLARAVDLNHKRRGGAEESLLLPLESLMHWNDVVQLTGFSSVLLRRAAGELPARGA